MVDNPPHQKKKPIVNHVLKLLVMFLLRKDKPEPEKYTLIKASKSQRLFLSMKRKHLKCFQFLFYAYQNFKIIFLSSSHAVKVRQQCFYT